MSKGVIEKEAGSTFSREEINVILTKMTADDFQKAYLDFVNNFLTGERFASYYGLTVRQAETIIATGRAIHETYCAGLKSLKGV